MDWGATYITTVIPVLALYDYCIQTTSETYNVLVLWLCL